MGRQIIREADREVEFVVMFFVFDSYLGNNENEESRVMTHYCAPMYHYH